HNTNVITMFSKVKCPKALSAVTVTAIHRPNGITTASFRWDTQMNLLSRFLFVLLLALHAPSSKAADPPAAGKQESSEGITHGFMAFGAETYRLDSENKVTWTYPANTRDGWLLPNDHVLLAVSKGKEFPGGGAVELK